MAHNKREGERECNKDQIETGEKNDEKLELFIRIR
jgi:hypothetical protein